ncbi:MAG TPA: MBL fold metallo-hydrolase [Candidatus Dormibacteraeota bacterium]|jgi:ribonuclease BN (tRNA processing enzyme)|nr:MBL fold metallo-hydrolase [Candidatus Dormibacteraeota bacterium]
MAERVAGVVAESTQVTVLGSGDAFSGCGCNAASLVDDRVLVDCGAPVQALLPRAGFAVADVDLVLLTHFHADHTYMLPMMLGARAFAGTLRRGLTIAGPPGTREYVLRLLGTGYGGNLVEMMEERLGLRWEILQDGATAAVEGYTIRAHAVVHSTGPSLAYTVQRGDGAVIGFSGDSTLCAGLRRVVDAADLMVCECTGWDAPTEGGHMWRGEVEQLIAEYPGTRFLLSHLRARGTVAGALIAHDLLSIDVSPAGRPVSGSSLGTDQETAAQTERQ